MLILDIIFEPVNESNYTLATVCLLLAIASIIALVFYNRKPQKVEAVIDEKTAIANKYKPLFSMGLFFVFLLCISTAFFSWLAAKKTTKVIVSEQFIETPFGKVDWGQIQRIYVHEDQRVAPFSGREVGEVTKILTIIEISGKTHALSEENYDINAIGKAIKERQQ